MNSNMFSLNTIGSLVIFLIFLVIINIALVIIYIIKYKKYEIKYNRIWSKFNNENLEDDIQNLLINMEDVENKSQASNILCSEINGKVTKCIQKVGFVKYDAYESGNNGLSFALALLDNQNNGVLLNSVYNRNYSNIYAKEITNGEVKGNLSEEENKALIKAINDKSFM